MMVSEGGVHGLAVVGGGQHGAQLPQVVGHLDGLQHIGRHKCQLAAPPHPHPDDALDDTADSLGQALIMD